MVELTALTLMLSAAQSVETLTDVELSLFSLACVTFRGGTGPHHRGRDNKYICFVPQQLPVKVANYTKCGVLCIKSDKCNQSTQPEQFLSQFTCSYQLKSV